jgi:hypothetical protein
MMFGFGPPRSRYDTSILFRIGIMSVSMLSLGRIFPATKRFPSRQFRPNVLKMQGIRVDG